MTTSQIQEAPMSHFAATVMRERYSHEGKEEWSDIAKRVATNVLGAVDAPRDLVDEVGNLINQRKFMPGGRYLYAAGRELHQVQNCLLLRAEDSREGWANHVQKSTMALMTGAGIGAVYSDLREKGALIRRTGGTSSGPLALMQMTNEVGRGAIQGGSRRAAIWAGLHWNHPDIIEFIKQKDWSEDVRAMKLKDFNFPATMDFTNISVILDTEFFRAFENANHSQHGLANEVYWMTVNGMLRTAEPGFSIDAGPNEGENLRNACTEITSHDDSDICNLGSVNMSRIESLEEMEHVTEVASAFLLAGTVYSHVPYEKVDEVRQKNRRIGLGLLGLHEWLLKEGKPYGPDEKLEEYLKVYKESADGSAADWANAWSLNRPVKTRAIAPTGTIGIVAETTTGVEPIFCAAFKRRYFDKGTWRFQYVLDPTAERLVNQGVAPETIEDAYSIDQTRRLGFQSWLQQYVDHAISSTINLPEWGSDANNEDTVQDFGDTLMENLPNLRGVTVYPDGARGGQPLTPVPYASAAMQTGMVYTEGIDICDITKGGSCGA
jgi:ribonucleoside-diphosphate reductase alpha chain